MFIHIANTAFNNKTFTSSNIGSMRAIHETTRRLYAAAKEIWDIEGPANVARLLNESPQLINNWERRGMSASGIIKAARTIGCRAEWLRSGDGDMVDRGAAKGTLREGKVSDSASTRQKPEPLSTASPHLVERTKSFCIALTRAAEGGLVTPQLLQALEGMLEAGVTSTSSAAFAKRSLAAIRAAVKPEDHANDEGQKRGPTR
ncbi:hypothetical protein [Burkholderia pseudomultivorans]|uniref:hypothetical protein n=1 Tax=Burkholderia pseudomultivorans TaxID=1207504 RepID=UPI0015823E26|nr:hypothetical protein [Burkholderia pseudomultivorans]